MKKKTKLSLIITGGVVASLLTFTLVVTITGKCRFNRDITDTSNESWMDSIKDETLLKDIVIPGSHDAGSDGMSYVSETQHLSIEKQLAVGVRYFDIRVNDNKGDLVIFHSIVNGQKFSGVLNTFKTFIVNHPSETLILDFQHFKNNSEEKVKDLLVSTFENEGLLVNNTTSMHDIDYISSLTLAQTRGKCLIFAGDDKKITDNYTWMFKRNTDEKQTGKEYSLESYYFGKEHKGSSKKFIENTLPKYYEMNKAKAERDGNVGLFVLQTQLTDGALIFGPYSRERGHDKNISKYIDDLPNKEYFASTNIIMRDFVNESKISSIINLNQYKNNLKN